MSLIAATSAARRRVASPAPYPIPTSAPWNAAGPIPDFPTPDTTGIAVHPDVIDFGAEGWNGYRFWMAVTPLANEQEENPNILVSNDPYNWQAPPGLTNPIEPPPPFPHFNSDTALVYDDTTDTLYCFWRYFENDDETIYYSKSTNGSTWTAKQMVLYSPGTTRRYTSPTFVKVSGGWRVYVCSQGAEYVSYFTITDLEQTWVPPTTAAIPTGMGLAHIDITKAGARWYAVGHSPSNGSNIRSLTSDDLETWTARKTIMQTRPGEWDSGRFYRPAIVPHENGTHMRMWYSAGPGAFLDRPAYTEIPLTEF